MFEELPWRFETLINQILFSRFAFANDVVIWLPNHMSHASVKVNALIALSCNEVRDRLLEVKSRFSKLGVHKQP